MCTLLYLVIIKHADHGFVLVEPELAGLLCSHPKGRQERRLNGLIGSIFIRY